MKILLIGATGGIGKRALELLLRNEQIESVRVLVRTPSKLPEQSHPKLEVCEMKDIRKVSLGEMTQHLDGCNVVLLCLGHEFNLHGMFGSGLLVLEANKVICSAIEQSKRKIKFIQVNTIGVSSPDGSDAGKRGWGTRFMIKLVSTLLPPFTDSKRVSEYLYKEVKHSDYVEWCAVRPDGLLDDPAQVTDYVVKDTVEWSLFRPETTTRVNCADFMCRLALDNDTLWQEWKFRFPIVLNQKQ